MSNRITSEEEANLFYFIFMHIVDLSNKKWKDCYLCNRAERVIYIFPIQLYPIFEIYTTAC